MSMVGEAKKLTKKELKSVFLRHYQILGLYSYERQQATPYCRAMVPALVKLYPKKDDLVKALRRHNIFFNTTCALVPFCLGISCAMEEEYANVGDEGMDPSSINTVKTALMGPLAGIGDSFFWGTFRVIAAGIGAPLAIQGNIAGLILYLLLNLLPSTVVRYYGFKIGYKGGRQFLTKISSDGTLNKATEAAKILGLTVIGGLVPGIVSMTLKWTIAFDKVTVDMQKILDGIMPGLLPLCLSLFVYWLLKKKANPNLILLGIIAAGILLTAVNVL
ncbi:MAG: PTS system mannose/fructose/sorbose family transporter subunit IID [Bacillota bacterium]|nr:PTS system mannose/fructose/sorbose family transporter subunit IID [Bacillota bacterium]